MNDLPKEFSNVLAAELEAIRLGRELRRQEKKTQSSQKASSNPTGSDGPPDDDPLKQADKMGLVGLAFSGGGIRSATFNLGVLQGLARLKLLDRFDYLSTVSGGGYIGSWLAAWIYRAGGVKTVEEKLNPQEAKEPCKKEAHEIHFLRDYSNYLTPRLGLLSADTWAAISTYLRNVILNLGMLVAILGAALIAPRLLEQISQRITESAAIRGWPFHGWELSLGLLVIGIIFIGRNLELVYRRPEGPPEFEEKQHAIQLAVLALLFVPAWLISCWIAFYPKELQSAVGGLARGIFPNIERLGEWADKAEWALLGALAYFGLWVLGRAGGHIWAKIETTIRLGLVTASKHTGEAINKGIREAWEAPGKTAREGLKGVPLILSALGAGAIGGVLLHTATLVVEYCVDWGGGDPARALWLVVTLGPPVLVVVFKLTVTFHIGLMGRLFNTEVREWWARLGAWLFIYTLIWLVFFGIALYAPLLVGEVGNIGGAVLGSGWLLSIWGGLYAGRSPEAGKKGEKAWLKLIGMVAPYVFVLGLVLGLSLLVHAVLGGATLPYHELGLLDHLRDLDRSCDSAFEWFVGLLVFGLALSWRVDINEFSMHNFYRNRLVRCYLGASHVRRRRPHPFTGIDPKDDVALAELSGPDFAGPYPIVNTTVNLTGGKHLAWQQRKGASFVFTPEYCGYEFPVKHLGETTEGYRETPKYGNSPKQEQTTGGPLLGTAVAISGAAASPNMGYHSSAALAFLMTVFNVRLGWWAGNPGKTNDSWKKSGPPLGLWYLLKELFGTADVESDFLYLSDGGHFENLGVYELVRRHCTLIVACDSEEDHKMQFGGLGNAIEKCRTDFGVDIEIDTEQLERDAETGYSQWHCVVGKIRYDRVCQGAPVGRLIYLKSSLTGDEPTDVQAYAARHAEFPHQTTADQWFGESQFESYRKLGFHVVDSAFGALGDAAALGQMSDEELAVKFRHRWYPPSRAIVESFARHTQTVGEIYQSLREDDDLKFMDAQVWPPWQKVMASGAAPTQLGTQLWLPASYKERRAGFYLCNRMIQLMENVYFDLNLEEEYEHPDNRGWMNWFRHWGWSGSRKR
jgi:hypothetical protein